MPKASRDPTPAIMLVMLPPEAAQHVVDHLIRIDSTLADDLAAIRQKYEPGIKAGIAGRRRPSRTQPKAAA